MNYCFLLRMKKTENLLLRGFIDPRGPDISVSQVLIVS